MQRYVLGAQFEDGFAYTGNQEDVGITPGRNVFFDIKEGLQKEHGRITQYSIMAMEPNEDGQYPLHRIDFTSLPESVKPIWYVNRERDQNFVGVELVSETEPRDMVYGFGYEFTNAEGKIEKEIIELV